MVRSKRDGASLARSLFPLIAALAVSVGAALALYRTYHFLFPFRSAPAGRCMYCGAVTPFGTRGWAAFCVRHGPLALLPPLIIIAETVSLFGAASSLWLILRAVFRRGVPRAFAWIVFTCAAVMTAAMVIRHGSFRLGPQFLMGAALLFFVLSAAYVDSLESGIVVIVAALLVAGALALLIQAIQLLLVGYVGMPI